MDRRSEVIDLCLVFHEKEKSTTSRTLELAEGHLVPQGFRLATGTNAYFAELNRQRPPRGMTVCYSFNPQVHAFDDLSLMETLEAQASTVESAAQRLLPVSVSDRQRIAALAFLEAGNRSTCLLANLTRRIQSVELRHLPAGLSVAMIDETHEPVTLEGTGLVWRSVPITRDQTSLALNPMALIKLEFT